MVPQLACPTCNSRHLDLRNYESMMVLRADLALFTLRCSRCGTKLSSIQPIPPSLKTKVEEAAQAAGAGMGKDRGLC